jgi:dienelactone hydrolase
VNPPDFQPHRNQENTFMPERTVISRWCLLATAWLFACSTSGPTPQAMAKAWQANLQYVKGEPFKHAVFFNSAAFHQQTNRLSHDILHIYIEGDGVPFTSPRTVAADPTPSNPLLLKLMKLDTRPSIYLGRPCYFSTQDSHCSPIWWTHNRYSPEVVRSMRRVLSALAEPYQGIVLMGYSGGATLATLIAEQEPKVKILVTLAGNLDTDAWVLEHGYSSLSGSLNPAKMPPLRTDLIQIHYAGAQDANIRAQWVEDFANRQRRAEFHSIKDADHSCCWESLWPEVLQKTVQYQTYMN